MRDQHAPSTVPAPPPLACDAPLRRASQPTSTRTNAAPMPDGRRPAAVALVISDSDIGEDRADANAFSLEEFAVVPGDTSGLDGRMVDVAGGASFLLCRRASRLNRHAGQWRCQVAGWIPVSRRSKPLRLDEELGVRLDDDAVLGLLDDYPTRLAMSSRRWWYGAADGSTCARTPTRCSPRTASACTNCCAATRRASCRSRERPAGRAGAAGRRPDPRRPRAAAAALAGPRGPSTPSTTSNNRSSPGADHPPRRSVDRSECRSARRGHPSLEAPYVPPALRWAARPTLCGRTAPSTP